MSYEQNAQRLMAYRVGRLIERLDRCQKAILRAELQDRPTTLRLELTYYQEQLDVASAWARERIEEMGDA